MMIAEGFAAKELTGIIKEEDGDYLDAAKSGILFLDKSFRIVTLNKEAEKICSVKRSRVIGTQAEISLRHLGEKFVKIFNAHEYNDFSTNIKVKSMGNMVYVQVDVLNLHDLFGKAIGVIVILQDVSAIRAAFKQIQTTKMLMSLGEVAAGVAHHIRTPLTTINGYLQVMLNRLEDEQYVVRREVLETLLEETTYINDVVKELVLFAKPPINKMNNVNINKVIGQSLLLNFRDLGSEKVQINKSLTEGLPLLHADGNLLKQAFVNIIQNALEAMPEEGILTVKSWLHAELNMIVVAVTDTGSGVAKEIFSKIFEPFYTSKLDHMGLGLPIAHRIITEHGGFIHISDEDEGGTRVHVYLPVIDEKLRYFPEVHQQILNLQ
ncbi:two-component system sensor histidine kinase AtoS [Sporomusaceae bacterium BoRhaA]|uniref:two-component system sensor histidine kinase NtrB n=1 Tax=Pelorhabdus rhamnosifermentans TaxID=2772457 RepID=UPI001FE6B90D|nr:ATP-binding protein [Pelorhabdus rhamnosifermentans]MBU2702467.1 two-component system sensor histidine kinase AtoS [Pelorhabdus rhamnosifermentans]